MSTLKTTFIQHPSAVSPSIELTPDGALSLDASAITTGKINQARLPMKKIAAFTASGTWTVPAGVTYAIAHMKGGGGGIGQTNTGGTGSASSVAFASGTVTANGGASGNLTNSSTISSSVGAANSGMGANGASYYDYRGAGNEGGQGALIVAGAAVTPAASITVTVGAGGTAGTSGAAGGSGYVYIEYYV